MVWQLLFRFWIPRIFVPRFCAFSEIFLQFFDYFCYYFLYYFWPILLRLIRFSHVLLPVTRSGIIRVLRVGVTKIFTNRKSCNIIGWRFQLSVIMFHSAVYIQSGEQNILTKTKIHEAVKRSLKTKYIRQLDITNCEHEAKNDYRTISG